MEHLIAGLQFRINLNVLIKKNFVWQDNPKWNTFLAIQVCILEVNY